MALGFVFHHACPRFKHWSKFWWWVPFSAESSCYPRIPFFLSFFFLNVQSKISYLLHFWVLCKQCLELFHLTKLKFIDNLHCLYSLQDSFSILCGFVFVFARLLYITLNKCYHINIVGPSTRGFANPDNHRTELSKQTLHLYRTCFPVDIY